MVVSRSHAFLGSEGGAGATSCSSLWLFPLRIAPLSASASTAKPQQTLQFFVVVSPPQLWQPPGRRGAWLWLLQFFVVVSTSRRLVVSTTTSSGIQLQFFVVVSMDSSCSTTRSASSLSPVLQFFVVVSLYGLLDDLYCLLLCHGVAVLCGCF